MHGAVPRSLELVKGPGGEQREGKNGVQAHRAGVGTCRRTDRQRHVATRRECRWGHRSGGPGAVSRKDSPLLTQDWGGGVLPDATSRVCPAVTSTVDEGWYVVAHSSQAESREGGDKERGNDYKGGDRAGAWV